MAPQIHIDPAIVERYIKDLAAHGAYGETGVWRTVYTPEWVGAQQQYIGWCKEAGLDVRCDAVGNVWGRLNGTENTKSIASGSHIDSQRPGGQYDGALGAIAALVAIRTLKERFGPPRRPIEAVAFCEEESSRFPAANFWGSRAVTGRIRSDEPDALRDYEGKTTIGEAMRLIGLDAGRISEAERRDIDTFIELHIEQGPILEQASLPVGIVTAITGPRHYVVQARGRADHAGAMPMDLRRDPMPGVAEIIAGVIETATRMGRPAVTTVGRLTVKPNGPAIVPEKVAFTIDARHPDPTARAQLFAQHESLISDVCQRRSLDLSWEITMDQPPCLSDPDVVRVIEEAAREQGVATMSVHSGAGHDSQVMANKCKVAMIFVQSRNGRSHTPDEFTSTEHALAGIQVLTAALHKLAY